MNQLKYESSPYLLQHANNPVHWFAWKPEAFEKARQENKPVLVSIGYSTCHWCHVMERESFEDSEVAEYMNKNFVCIKVDREERPDVDQIYMEACQLLTGGGGWPLNCFLTPDKKPFYAGTYFPPVPRHNLPSWIQVLMKISDIFQTKPDVLQDQGNRILDMIGKPVNRQTTLQHPVVSNSEESRISAVHLINKNLKSRFDTKNGGFGYAPKFPGTMSLQYLLDYYYYFRETESLLHVEHSLQKMILGGIYDQLGGGFARYATDAAWLIPHFEKMLYDNALLVTLLSDLYKHTRNPLYQTTIHEILEWVSREMTSPEKGFYSAIDADSEGEEGKYYIWEKKEIDEALGDEAHIFCDYFGVTNQGNWEGKNILHRKYSIDEFAAKNGMQTEQVVNSLQKSRQILLNKRQMRIRPALDDKILLDWNALMCTAFAKAFTATANNSYRRAAIDNLEFIMQNLLQADRSRLFHTYKDGVASVDAFLDDYAFLIEAMLNVYEISFETKWLMQAERYTRLILDNFLDTEDKLFYFTSELHKDIPIRKKDTNDAATPSGNSTMVSNLYQLSAYLGNLEYQALADDMISKMEPVILKYPGSFGKWTCAFLGSVFGFSEIAIIGNSANDIADKIQKRFIPHRVIMASEGGDERFPLLRGRDVSGESLIYLCRQFVCQKPVNNLDDFFEQLEQLRVSRNSLN